MPDRLIFTKNGADISEGIELRHGKGNVFGWSQYEIWLTEQAGEDYVEYQIGGIDCGTPFGLADGIGYRIEREGQS